MGQFSNRPDFVTEALSVSAGDAGLDSVVLFVGTGGDLEVVPAGQATSVIFKNVADGSFLPIVITEIKSAGTTADDLIALK